MIRCLAPGCNRSLAARAGARICPSCWRFVSPALRLAIEEHAERWRYREAGFGDFLDWSWRVTFVLAAWEAAHERRARRIDPNAQPWSAPFDPPLAPTLEGLLRRTR